MKLHIRRYMLILAYIAFLAIAPIIVLYAVGYRPAGITQTPQAVGVALIDASPKRASVEVGGISYGTLPRSIPNLFPGLVPIRITKNGYQIWEKKLEIRPAQATDAREILLVPTSPDQDNVLPDSSLFFVSNQRKRIASVDTKNKLSVFSESKKVQTNSIPFRGTITQVVWSPEDTKILVQTKDKKTVALLAGEATLEKSLAVIPVGLENMIWDTASEDSFFAETPTHDLIRYSISTQTTEHIMSDINEYTIHKNTILVQKNDNALFQIPKNERNNISPIINLEKRVITFLPSTSQRIALLLDNQDLVLTDNLQHFAHVASNVSSASWSPDNLLLLIQTSKEELNIYNTGNTRLKEIPQGELHLLVRLSSPITNPMWFSDSRHVLYQHDGNIILSEIDPRDHAITNIIGTSSVSNPNITIESEGVSLLHLQKEKQATALIRTWLVTEEDK